MRTDFLDYGEEYEETPMDIFVSDNRDELMNEFIGDNQDLWEAFNLQFGEDTHGDFIKAGFCEYHYDKWNRFCREKFRDYEDDMAYDYGKTHK